MRARCPVVSFERKVFETKSVPTIAIVGCGLSGAAAAVSLLEQARAPIRLAIFNAAGAPGAGLAYGGARASDLLNVRASSMKLFAGRDGDFASWLTRAGRIDGCAYTADDFAPRRLFGRYVRERLAETIADNPQSRIDFVDAEVIAISRAVRRRYIVQPRSGAALHADAVIIATGYGARRRERFGLSPYDPLPDNAFEGAQEATIIGAGLTAVDVALDLADSHPELAITMISRRGRLPLAHSSAAIGQTEFKAPQGDTALDLLRAVRSAARASERSGSDWRVIVNGLRPHAQELWMRLPAEEKRRFARRLKVYWDIHRHRLPPQNAARLAALADEGRIRVIAGDVRRERANDRTLTVRPRGSSVRRNIAKGPVIDCAGFGPDLDAPAIKSLVAQELAFHDDVGVGLKVDRTGRLLDAGDAIIRGLYAIGPIGAGSLLEVTAAPEIAEQAAKAAASICRDLAPLPAVRRISRPSSAAGLAPP